jgi:hypothetical protein
MSTENEKNTATSNLYSSRFCSFSRIIPCIKKRSRLPNGDFEYVVIQLNSENELILDQCHSLPVALEQIQNSRQRLIDDRELFYQLTISRSCVYHTNFNKISEDEHAISILPLQFNKITLCEHVRQKLKEIDNLYDFPDFFLRTYGATQPEADTLFKHAAYAILRIWHDLNDLNHESDSQLLSCEV